MGGRVGLRPCSGAVKGPEGPCKNFKLKILKSTFVILACTTGHGNQMQHAFKEINHCLQSSAKGQLHFLLWRQGAMPETVCSECDTCLFNLKLQIDNFQFEISQSIILRRKAGTSVLSLLMRSLRSFMSSPCKRFTLPLSSSALGT